MEVAGSPARGSGIRLAPASQEVPRRGMIVASRSPSPGRRAPIRFVGSLAALLVASVASGFTPSGLLEIHYINVSQGGSMLGGLEDPFPLLDAGPKGTWTPMAAPRSPSTSPDLFRSQWQPPVMRLWWREVIF